jgi:hypothetical protein
MRKLYLFLTFILAVTCIFSLMAASAGLYEGYERQARLERLENSGEKFQATVVEKRLPKVDRPSAQASGDIVVELRSGPRQGQTIPVPVSVQTFSAIAEGQAVTIVLSPEGAHLVAEQQQSGGALALVIALLSFIGALFTARQVRRTPA